MRGLIASVLNFTIFLLITFAPAQNSRYIAYAGHGYGTDVDVIDLSTMSIDTTIVGAGGYRMVLTPDGSKLYSTGGDNLLYISDAIADTLLQAVDPSIDTVFSSELEGITISPDGKRVYVIDESSDALFVWDTQADTLIDAIDFPSLDEPENIVISSDGAYLYINDNSYVTKIRTDSLKIVKSLYIDNDGHGIAISSDDSTIFADGQGIDVIRTTDMSLLTSLLGDGYYLTTSEDGSRVYGVDEGRHLSIVDAQNKTLISNITLSKVYARGVTTYAGGDTILVATTSGLLKLDAANLNVFGTNQGSYQSVVVKAATPVKIGSARRYVPNGVELHQNYPNPFNPGTTIVFRLPEAGHIQLDIFNLQGQRVRSLINQSVSAGQHYIRWNGLDQKGKRVASGIYIYRLQFENRYVKTRKMILLK